MKKILLIILALSLLTQCGIYRKTDARKVPGNVNDRVQKNLEEGKRIRFGGGKGRGGGNFSFATSNEMWRATIEILDFIPLNNADYGGGIIITDWYSEDGTGKDSIKIMVRFLSNEIRADGLDVIIHKKKCVNNTECSVTKVKSTLANEIKVAILKEATILKSQDPNLPKDFKLPEKMKNE